jgi:polysaccharide biosynthesis protein PslH
LLVMRVLWVKAGGFVPLDSGGKIRSFHIAKALASCHEVTIFSYHAPLEDDPHQNLRSIFDDVVIEPVNVARGRGLQEAVNYLRLSLSSLPYSIAKYSPPHVKQRLASVLRSQIFDVLLIDFVGAGAVVPWEADIPKVVFTHNVEATIWKRHAEIAKNPVWRAVFRREHRRMEATEIDYLGRAQHVLTVSDTDAEAFREHLPQQRITTIPTGVDAEYFKPQNLEEEDHIVFTGSMDWMPNEDGMIYFVEDVLPLIREERPNSALWIVGRSPSARILHLGSKDPLIRVTGRVDDVRPYIARGTAYIVPLRVGSGTRLKIFEAMAMGKAVVSTTIGAEGLPLSHGSNGFLADSPEEFARCTCRLLGDRNLRQSIGSAARELVLRSFSWDAVARKFGDALQAAVDAGRAKTWNHSILGSKQKSSAF